MFNKRASSERFKPDEIMKALNIKPGQRIADIGAGGGYFSFRFAEAVGRNGEVSAIDRNDDYLKYIREDASKRGLSNIKIIKASENNANLPNNYFNLIFFRNVLHHIENRVLFMKSIKPKLKPGGRIAVIEYKPGGSIFSFRRLFGHNIPKEKIIGELNRAGFRKSEEFNFLPEQSFMIFTALSGP